MALELILLGALIFVFLVSFCGLLQKIRQTYERERLLAERPRRVDVPQNDDGGVFPATAAPPPPPYSRRHADEPPKYEEIVEVHETRGPAPPPYTIAVN